MSKKVNRPYKKIGRKSKYFTNIEPNLETIRMLRRDGEIEADLAKRFGIAYSTWNEYKLKHPEFKAAIAEEMDFVVAKTEKSLYNSAWGERIPQVKRTYELNRRTGEKELVKEEVLPDKIIAPNVTAQKFILMNMARLKWKERVENTIEFDEHEHNKETLLEKIAKAKTGED